MRFDSLKSLDESHPHCWQWNNSNRLLLSRSDFERFLHYFFAISLWLALTSVKWSGKLQWNQRSKSHCHAALKSCLSSVILKPHLYNPGLHASLLCSQIEIIKMNAEPLNFFFLYIFFVSTGKSLLELQLLPEFLAQFRDRCCATSCADVPVGSRFLQKHTLPVSWGKWISYFDCF